MVATVEKKKMHYEATEKRDGMCQYLDNRGCKATAQKNCIGCRFATPCTGHKANILEQMATKQHAKIEELEENVEKLEDQVYELSTENRELARELATMQFIAATHYGED